MALLYIREISDEQFTIAKKLSHQGQFSRSLLVIMVMGSCNRSYTCVSLEFP